MNLSAGAADLTLPPVDTSWNGVSEAHSLDMHDHFCYEQRANYGYEVSVDLPGMSRPVGEHVVQLAGSDLPSLHKTSTYGLQHKPDCLNPYLDQRDASYVYGDGYHNTAIAGGTLPEQTT